MSGPWLTLRAGLRQSPLIWPFLAVVVAGFVITLGTVAFDPVRLQRIDLRYPAMIYGVILMICAVDFGTWWPQLNQSELLRLAPRAAKVLTQLYVNLHLGAAICTLATYGVLWGMGLDATRALTFLGLTSVMVAFGLPFAALRYRHPAGFIATVGIFFAAISASARGMALDSSLWLLALPCWPVTAWWFWCWTRATKDALRVRAIQAPAKTRLKDTWMRTLHRPAFARGRFRRNQNWSLQTPPLSSTESMRLVIVCIFGALLRNMYPEMRQSVHGALFFIFLAVWTTPVVGYVEGIERLLLLPGGTNRARLPQTLRRLYLMTGMPAIIALTLGWIVYDALILGRAQLSQAHPWSYVAISGTALGCTLFASSVLVAHPAIVRFHVLTMVTWFAFATAVAVGAGFLLINEILPPMDTATGALQWAGSALVASTALGSLAMRMGRMAWLRADIAPIVEEWRYRREQMRRYANFSEMSEL